MVHKIGREQSLGKYKVLTRVRGNSVNANSVVHYFPRVIVVGNAENENTF